MVMKTCEKEMIKEDTKPNMKEYVTYWLTPAGWYVSRQPIDKGWPDLVKWPDHVEKAEDSIR